MGRKNTHFHGAELSISVQCGPCPTNRVVCPAGDGPVRNLRYTAGLYALFCRIENVFPVLGRIRILAQGLPAQNEGFAFWHRFDIIRYTTRNVPKMKTTNATTLIARLVLAAAFLFAGMSNAAAQTTSKNAATPALMLSFDGQVNSGAADLNWVMENENNCKWFVIERSGETGGYDSISVVQGINGNNINAYTFSDNHMMNGNNYYRLRQVDRDGVVRYSKIVNLYNDIVENAAPKMSVYPNPAVSTLNYTLNSAAPQQVIVQVYNMAGVALFTTEQQLNAGNNQQTVALNGLKNGNYILRITNRAGNSQYVQPFVKMM
jgi:hypothetical protein